MAATFLLVLASSVGAARPSLSLSAARARPSRIVLAEAASPLPAPARSRAAGLAVLASRVGASAALFAAGPAFAAAAASAGAAKLHIGQKLALKLQASGLPNEAILALISMMPVVELRGAVPVGAWLGVPPLRSFAVCVLGNSLAVLLLLLALRLPPVEALLKPVLDKARTKVGGLATDSNLPLALAVFVGVPLPGTGGWTGAMIAHILGMPLPLAFASVGAGVVMAGVIMSALTLAGWYGAAIASGALGAFCVGALLKRGRA